MGAAVGWAEASTELMVSIIVCNHGVFVWHNLFQIIIIIMMIYFSNKVQYFAFRFLFVSYLLNGVVSYINRKKR